MGILEQEYLCQSRIVLYNCSDHKGALNLFTCRVFVGSIWVVFHIHAGVVFHKLAGVKSIDYLPRAQVSGVTTCWVEPDYKTIKLMSYTAE